MRWDRKLAALLFHNWREKLVALVIAFFFWYLVRAQIRETAARFIALHGDHAAVEDRLVFPAAAACLDAAALARMGAEMAQRRGVFRGSRP